MKLRNLCNALPVCCKRLEIKSSFTRLKRCFNNSGRVKVEKVIVYTTVDFLYVLTLVKYCTGFCLIDCSFILMMNFQQIHNLVSDIKVLLLILYF